MIDGRIVGATENLVRSMYKLTDSYETMQCNVKSRYVEIEMSNGLIVLRVKVPRDVVDSYLETDFNRAEEPVEDANNEDGTNEPTTRKKIVRKA